MTRFYIEFENTESQKLYNIQSRYFKTKESALKWYKQSFDFIDTDEIIVSLMRAEFTEDGFLKDIFVEDGDITTRHYLKA